MPPVTDPSLITSLHRRDYYRYEIMLIRLALLPLLPLLYPASIRFFLLNVNCDQRIKYPESVPPVPQPFNAIHAVDSRGLR